MSTGIPPAITGILGRVTVIGVQSPVDGATPVVCTNVVVGVTGVVGMTAVVRVTAEVVVAAVTAVLSWTSFAKNAKITPPAASAHATRTRASRHRALRRAKSGDD